MRIKGGVTGEEGDVGSFFCLYDFCLIEALLYNEECHSETSTSFTTTPELDCTEYIWIIQYVFSFSDASEMRSSTHSSSVTATLVSVSAKHKFK